ncbi:hypothetical protein KSP39_PZI010408 [Platanthera zijinensis]|uniref:Uncharacterized protein n=1 Tax=Platanthera zijinensis TaxID=2320716 RepID=A0AAP0BJL4_9ASPA
MILARVVIEQCEPPSTLWWHWEDVPPRRRVGKRGASVTHMTWFSITENSGGCRQPEEARPPTSRLGAVARLSGDQMAAERPHKPLPLGKAQLSSDPMIGIRRL